MAQHMTSGAILRDARERKGLDLGTVARRLRIRTDILRAIESGDFSAMPPRGYARNMVNAYARFVGLNPSEIVELYLDEAYANQVNRARSSSGVRFDMGRETRRATARSHRSHSYEEDSLDEDGYPIRRRGALGRDLYDDRTEFARPDYGLNRGSGAGSRGKRTREHRDTLGGLSLGSFGAGGRQPRQSTHRAMSQSRYVNAYAGPARPNLLQSKLPVVVAAAIALVAIIVVCVVVLGNRQSAAEDVATLPVTGITDTTGAGDVEAADETQAPAKVEKAPQSIAVTYGVKTSGAASYVEVYTDGTRSSAETLTGPVERTADVTGTWTITTWAPEVLIVTVDGQQVQLASDAAYGGMYSYTVDFNQVLSDWNRAHGVTDSSAAAPDGSSGAQKSASGAAGSSASGAAGSAAGTSFSGGTSPAGGSAGAQGGAASQASGTQAR